MMVDMYVSKHRIIQEYLETVDDLAKKGIKENSEQIAQNINKMTGVLKMHLASEDNFLYPILLASENAKVKEITKKYMAEIGDLAEIYGNFAESFNTPSKIVQDTGRFLETFKSIVSALTLRIEREEMELYPLVK